MSTRTQKYESTKKWQKEYNKRVYKSIPVRISLNTEKEVYDYVNEQPNKRQDSINLIREDLKQSKE